jgi:Recombination endonuclease VII
MPRIAIIARRSSPPAAPIARRIAIGSIRSGATSGARMPSCARATAPRAWAGLMASAAEEHRRLLDAQNGVCAVCKLPSRRTLCVDHCHATRQVRGLLCDKCNTALGLLGDDSKRMRAAAAYVDRARGFNARGK